MALTAAQLNVLLQGLSVSPDEFIRRYVLYTPGTNAPAASGIVQAFVSEGRRYEEKTRPGSRLGVLSRPFHKTDAVSISNFDPNAGPAGPAGAPVVPVATIQVGTHWIATSFHPPGAAAAAFPWYTLTAGSVLMLTQRLTGCSFVIDPAGGGPRVAHIMPDPAETGAQLRARLVTLLGAGVTIYGRGEYSEDREATIAGVHNGHEWRIYVQKQDLLSFKVRSSRQIFP